MAISRRRLLASAAALGAVSASAGIFAPAIAQNKPVRIGILAPRSGIAAAPGENGIRATQWAVEKYNAKDGIGGRKVELVIEDESSPKDTIERFSKLVQQEKVDCVQGIVSSGVGLALGPVIEEPAHSRFIGTERRKTASTKQFPIRNISSARPTTNARR
jgi:branched-chain amino acid transport system substrate-binding protein